MKGVFILEEEDAEKFESMLEKYQATYYSIPILLGDEEIPQIRHR